MFVNNSLYSRVAPDVAVQHLAGELLHVLNVDHQPFIGCPASITGLRSTQTNAKHATDCREQKYCHIIMQIIQYLSICNITTYKMLHTCFTVLHSSHIHHEAAYRYVDESITNCSPINEASIKSNCGDAVTQGRAIKRFASVTACNAMYN